MTWALCGPREGVGWGGGAQTGRALAGRYCEHNEGDLVTRVTFDAMVKAGSLRPHLAGARGFARRTPLRQACSSGTLRTTAEHDSEGAHCSLLLLRMKAAAWSKTKFCAADLSFLLASVHTRQGFSRESTRGCEFCRTFLAFVVAHEVGGCHDQGHDAHHEPLERELEEAPDRQ